MGATTQTRQYAACSAAELQRHFDDELEEMAREGGTDAYCGNWNSNEGLFVTTKQFATHKEAEDYLDKNCEKRESVLAVRVGDFGKSWPETKAQKALIEKAEALTKEYREFEYRILERAHKQKSKTKKCGSCESTINVHKIALPRLSELSDDCDSIRFSGNGYRFMGRFLKALYFGLTDCPVCSKNLLKTETDVKNEASLKKRMEEASKKVYTEKAEYEKSKQGKPRAYWLVSGLCGC